MTDAVDISGMPPPPPELVSGDDSSAGMPTPAEVFRQNVGRPPENDVELDNFTHNPENWARSPQTPRTGKDILSRATGVGQAAAQAALAVPAAVAGAAGYARGALAAGLEYSAHPHDKATANANALKDLETGRERGRRWAGNVYDLSKYVPATKEGEEFAQQDVPAAIGSAAQTVGKEALEPVIGENATRAVGDVAQDLSIVAPALGVPGYAKGAVDLTKKVAAKTVDVAKAAAARVNPKAPEGTTYSAEGTAEAPSTVPYTAEVPPVRQVSANTILNKPDPIPPPEPRQTPQETRSTPSVDPGAPDPVPLSNNRERGSVRVMRDKGEEGPLSPLFYAPKEDGAQQQADPTQEPARIQSLKDLNALSGGTMEGYRPSAVTGDYRATAQDFHDANGRDPAGQQMAAQLASEHEAPAEATRRLHQQLGSGQLNSVDPEVLAQGGRTVRDAVHGVEDWHEGATNQIYDAARSGNAGRTLPRPARVDHILNDDGNFVTTNAQALQKAAKAQLDRLWTTGDPDQGIPPGSINGAEAFRQFLNEAHPDSQGVVKKLKNALDMHVAENGGPGLFEVARNQKIHESQQLGPKFMQKFLQPTRGDLDHPVDVRQWMDRAVNLPPEQFNHFMNVIESGAHLDKANLAPKSAAAIKALQAHVVSRIYEASRGEGGKWNARNFYDRASSYAPNLRRLFADNPEALERLQTINRGSNVLKMDSHYPGAAAQAALTGLGESGMHGAREKAGVAARGLVDLGAHSVLGPLGPTAAEISGVSGKAQRLIAGPTPAERVAADRAARVKGNIRPLERGSVGVMPEEDNWFGGKKIPGVDTQSKQPTEADFAHAENVTMETPHEHFIDDDGNHVFRTSDGNTELKAEPKGNTLQMRGALTKPGSERGGGSLLYQKIAEYATQNGGKLGSDFSVSKDAQRRWTELHRNGWDVKQHPEAVRTANGTLIAPRDEPVYMVNGRRPNAPGVEPASGTVPMGQRPAFAGQRGSVPLGARIGGGSQRGSVSGKKVGPNLAEKK